MDIQDANESQRAAIMHLRGPCLVLAGPGSGKTYTITKRILYLLEQGIPPESVLVITFTKEAALSMQNRFLEMAGAGHAGAPVYPVCFGTFHSVFFHILKQSNALKSNRLLSGREKKSLLLPILESRIHSHTLTSDPAAEASVIQRRGTRENLPGGQFDLEDDAAVILSAISYYKNTMELSEARRKAPVKWQPDFEAVMREYGRAVKVTGRIDFDDMLYGCRALLRENAAARSYWQNRFRHILIDEFQDINPVQYEVVKLLAAEPFQIFAVGDDDQSIYGFRGSEPECMKRFETEFGARRLLLGTNYRSRHGIVQASSAVIGENRDRFAKRLHAACGREDGISCTVSVLSFPGKEEQYAYLLGSLSGHMPRGGSRAVLFRTNAYMQGFASRLKAAGVPYEMRERQNSIYGHFIVEDIMAYLLTARGEGTRGQMLRIMNRPSRYISREAVGEGGADVESMLEYYDRVPCSGKQAGDVKAALARFGRQLGILRGLSLVQSVNYCLKAMGYEKYLWEISRGKPGKWQEWQEILEWLKGEAAGMGSLREWLDFQKEYTDSMARGGAGTERCRHMEGKGNPVQLLTVHGAKGLEFDRVWIPDCNEKVFPHGTMPDVRQVEEERRIFYVAMTRAKKNLELLYLTGTKERPRPPSRFLNPLFGCPEVFYSSSSSSNSQLSRYSSNASATFSYSSSSSI